MRIYGSIHVSFWGNNQIQALSDQSKVLAIYLLTCPHSNMLGCFRLPDGYITEDLRWDIQTVKKAFHELADIDFLTRDEQTGWLVIHDFLKWNPIQNSRQGIGIHKLFEGVPTHSTVFKPLVKGLLKYGDRLEKPFRNRLETLQTFPETLSDDCLTDKDQNQDQEQNQKKIFMSSEPDVDLLSSENINFDKPKIISFKSQAEEVLQFLNEKTGRAYRPVETNLKLIMARLKSGASLAECFQVIAKKTREWKSDAKMVEYLRPATLFNATKFEQYVGELVLPKHEESAV